MLAAALIIALTAAYLALGRAGMARLDAERKSLKPLKALPLVSIIIPSYKSQDTISDTLRSAKALDYPRKEIIVVNDSHDDTPSIARRFGARVIQQGKRTGKPQSLNRATKAARGDLILVLDADTAMDRGSLKRMVRWFSADDVAAVMPLYDARESSPTSVMASLENALTFSLIRIHMLFRTLVGFRGCSVLLRKSVLEKHPWPETLLEDNHLAATLVKSGHRIIWEPLARSVTDEPSTLSGLARQKRRWGEGAYFTFRHHQGFYMRSPQFILFIYPYLALGGLAGLLFLGLLLTPLFLAGSALGAALDLLWVLAASYIHIVLLLWAGSGRPRPLESLRFMLLYVPVASLAYFSGLFSGMRRRMRGGKELHFESW